jgi:hypothetical protein
MNYKEIAKRYLAKNVENISRLLSFHKDTMWTLGGDSPLTGFDCSGLVFYLLSQLGYQSYSYDRYSAEQLFNKVFTLNDPDPRLGEYGHYCSAFFGYTSDANHQSRLPFSGDASFTIPDSWHVAMMFGGSHIIESTLSPTMYGAASLTDFNSAVQWWRKGGAETFFAGRMLKETLIEGVLHVTPGMTVANPMAPLDDVVSAMMEFNPLLTVDGAANRSIQHWGDQQGFSHPSQVGLFTDKWVINVDDPNYEASKLANWNNYAGTSYTQLSFLYFPVEWFIELCKGMTWSAAQSRYVFNRVPTAIPDQFVREIANMEYSYLPLLDTDEVTVLKLPHTVFESLDGQGRATGWDQYEYVFCEPVDNFQRGIGDALQRLDTATLAEICYMNVPMLMNILAYQTYRQFTLNEEGQSEFRNGLITRSVDDFLTRRLENYTAQAWVNPLTNRRKGSTVTPDSDSYSPAGSWIQQRFLSAETLAKMSALLADDGGALQTQNKYVPARLA